MSINQSTIRTESPEGNKITNHFSFCYESTGFNEGDTIPIGGSTFVESTDELDIGVIADFENFSDFFNKMDVEYENADIKGIQDFLDRKGIKLSAEIFALTNIFSRMLDMTYPGASSRGQVRDLLYQQHKGGIKLSDAFKNGCAACAEISALAQEYLRRKNIPTSYFHGFVAFEQNGAIPEFPEAHTFVPIRHKGKVYIYDPANNSIYKNNKFQSLYSTESDFDLEMSRNEKKLVTSTNLITDEKVYFGTSDGNNILPEHHIV